MQVQNHVWGPAIMTVICALANVPINIWLIKYYDFWGAAVATSVARILLLVLLIGMSGHHQYLCWSCCKNSSAGPVDRYVKTLSISQHIKIVCMILQAEQRMLCCVSMH